LIEGNITKYTMLKVHFVLGKISNKVTYVAFILKDVKYIYLINKGIKETFLKIINEISETNKNVFRMI